MVKMTADLDRTAKQMKDDVRERLSLPSTAAANPFGPENETAGDAGGNHFAQNTRYLKSHASGNYKAAQYLAAYGNTDGVAAMVEDTMETLFEEGNDLVTTADALVANFLVSVYVEKHGWKAGAVEEAAARRFAEEIDAHLIEYETPARAAKNEGRKIDRTLVTDDGERVTVQVKTNTSRNVSADAVDYVLRVSAEVDEKEIEFDAEEV